MTNTQSLSVLDAVYPFNFQDTELQVLDVQGRVWLTAADLDRALGYSRTGEVSRLYRRHSDEFTEDMTTVIALQANESNENASLALSKHLQNKVRIFSTQGCHLVGMLARTDKAKEFRRWVLDVLENLNKETAQPTQQPEPRLAGDAMSLAARIACPLRGPALTELPAIMSACAERLNGAMCLPHFQSAPPPSDLPEFLLNTTSLRPDQVENIAVAALKRVRNSFGASGVQRVLRGVNHDFLLLNESDLDYTFYRSRRLMG